MHKQVFVKVNVEVDRGIAEIVAAVQRAGFSSGPKPLNAIALSRLLSVSISRVPRTVGQRGERTLSPTD